MTSISPADTSPTALARPPHPRFRSHAGTGSWLAWSVALAAGYIALTAFTWHRSLIWDEIWLLFNVGQPLSHQIAVARHDVVHPPLVYLLFRWWLQLFGETEFAAKALVLLINVATLTTFTRLAFVVTRHWRAASLLFAGIYFQVGSVPNLIRAYGLLLLMVVLSLQCWHAWMETGRRRWLAGWAGCMTVALYLHYFAALLVGGYVVLALLRRTMSWQVVAAAGIPALAILPWLAYVAPEYGESATGVPASIEWVTVQDLHRTVVELPASFVTYIDPGSNPFRPRAWFETRARWRLLTWAALLVHGLLAFWAWRGAAPNKGHGGGDGDEWLWTLGVLALVPVVALYGASLAIAPVFHPRFLLGLMPVYWLLIVVLGDRGGQRGRALVYGVVLPWVWGSAVLVSARSARPSPLHEQLVRVALEIAPGDLLLGDSNVGDHLFWEWTRVFRRSEPVAVFRAGDGEMPYREQRGNNIVPYSDLDAIDLPSAGRLWLFHSRESEVDRVRRACSATGACEELRSPEADPRWGPTVFVRDPGS